jgi:sarcosine oxidase subunit beta
MSTPPNKNEGAAVVIVGAGIVGASVAHHLAARGERDVLVLEKQDRELAGSTARSVAGVRHQFATEVNVRLSLHSIERLKRFGEEVGGHAELRQVGYLLLVSDRDRWEAAQRAVALQRSLGVRSRLLEPGEVLEILPQARVDDLLGASFCPDDGHCDPHGVAAGYLGRARERGVRVRREAPVVGVRRAGGRVVAVETPAGPVSCDFVVNAAGAWAGRVAALAGLELPVAPYRRCVYVTEPFALLPDPMPLTIDVASGFYMRREGPSVLFGLSNEGEPSSERLDVDWPWLESVLEAGVARFPVLEQAGLARRRCWAGLYEITPDHLPVLGRHPELPNYLDASGFSGHGVMHAPATGMLIAEEILDGRAHSIDIDPLRIARFRGGTLRPETNVF